MSAAMMAKDNTRKYRCSWDLLGNVELGRPNPGQRTRLEIYRLMWFSFRDVRERHLGADETDRLFYSALGPS